MRSGSVRETIFDDVFDSQRVIRTLLEVLARPGTVGSLPALDYRFPPEDFCAPALSIMKTLCDHRVSFSVGAPAHRAAWVRYLEVNLATPVAEPADAGYVLFDGSSFDEDFSRLSTGCLEFPEASATALLGVGLLESLPRENGSTGMATLRLSGPGVKATASLRVAGLDPRYLEQRARANRFYPLGIDLLLVDRDGRVAGIPRTSAIEVS